MGTACLNLLLSSIFILTIVTALSTHNHGNCTSASPTDRLAVNITEPKIYIVKLVLRPNYNEFFGISNILIQVNQRTKTISLHAYGIQMKLDDIELQLANRTAVSFIPVNYRYCKVSQILELYFSEDIIPAHYYLIIPITVNMMHTKFKGLSRYNYSVSETHQRSLMTNLFSSNTARRMFPCWDQPEIKASFNISVLHTSEYRVFSNMPIVEVLPKVNNWERTYFGVSPLIAASELVIVMFDNKTLWRVQNIFDVSKIMWNRPEKTLKLEFFRFTINRVKIALFTNALGQIIIPETVYIVLPDIPTKVAGFATYTIYREEDVIYSPSLHFSGRKLQILQLLARQEALQWFDRASISPSWLRESFAMYFSHYFPIEPYYSLYSDLFTVQVLQPILHYDIVMRMKPIIHEVKETDAIDEFLYSRLNGYKGSIMLRMLENILTPKVFHQRILQYVKKLEHHSDESNKFWDALQNSTDNADEKRIYNISDIMNNWLRQEKFPELFVACYNETIYIDAVCGRSIKWNISTDIFMVTNYNIRYLYNAWINCYDLYESPLINYGHDINFVIVNLYQFGYYRVNYDNEGWIRIISYLQYNNYTNIPVENRAQLIDDAYYYVINGKVSPFIFFDLIRYLKRETDYVPWYPMFNILTYLSTYMELSRSKNIKPVILESLDGLLRQIGYEELLEDNEKTNSLRLLASRWACKLGHTECQKTAASKLLRELESSRKSNLLWWKDWVYCMGMKRIGKEIWNSIFSDFFVKKNVDTFKYLACTDDDTLLIYYMNALIEDKRIIDLIGITELMKHYRSILKRHLRKNVVLKHVLTNLNDIINRLYGIDNLITFWGDVILNLDKAQIDVIKNIFQDVVEHFTLQPNVSNMFLNARLLYIQKLDEKFFNL